MAKSSVPSTESLLQCTECIRQLSSAPCRFEAAPPRQCPECGQSMQVNKCCLETLLHKSNSFVPCESCCVGYLYINEPWHAQLSFRDSYSLTQVLRSSSLQLMTSIVACHTCILCPRLATHKKKMCLCITSNLHPGYVSKV